MRRLLADENIPLSLTRGLRQRIPTLNLLIAQEVGLVQTDDHVILEWAAHHGRILLTHDRRTMVPLAHERILQGKTMPGLVIVSDRRPLRLLIDDLELLLLAGDDTDFAQQIRYVPL